MKALHISDDLSLPIDAVTRRMAILAMSGAGKSNLAVVLAEAMFDAGIPWVAIDPKGDWWGVRSNESGKGPGLPIPIFGGLHGDVPLEPTAGRVIADLIIGQRLTCVLDVSEFPDRQGMWAFLHDLGESMLRNNREALHLFLEEADEYLPQRPGEKGNLPKCKGTWQRVVKRGRFRGLGSTQISQRSASLDKDTLYQAEVLFALRVTGKGDKVAIEGWVEHHNAAAEIVASLPTLADGEGWVSSPAYLKTTQRVQFNRRRTFDSGATPVLLKGTMRPATLADIDLAAIQSKMTATIERAKADDPKELRKQIAELKRTQQKDQPDPRAIERAVQKAVGEAENRFEFLQRENINAINDLRSRLDQIAKLATLNGNAPALAEYKPIRPRIVVDRPAPAPRPAPRATSDSGGIDKAQRAFLSVLAQRQGKATTRNQLAVLAGYSATSRHVDNVLSALRSKAYVDGRGDLYITDAGLDALGDFTPLPTGRELLNYWLNKLDAGPSAMLRALSDVYPDPLTRNEVAERAGYSVTSRHVDNCLSTLRTRELIEGRGELKASEELFD